MFNYNYPYLTQFMNYYSYGNDFTQEALITALELIQEAIHKEGYEELTYQFLIETAPNQEEADIIASIRDDVRNHRNWFREIYQDYTGQELNGEMDEDYKEPTSYINGISRAIFEKLSSMESYRKIREGLPNRIYREVIFGILSDEMKHTKKFKDILSGEALKGLKELF